MRAGLVQGGNTQVEPNDLISALLRSSVRTNFPPTSSPNAWTSSRGTGLDSIYELTLVQVHFTLMSTRIVNTHLCACTQAERANATQFLSGSCCLPSMIECFHSFSA